MIPRFGEFFFTALAYHFCLALPAAFTQPGYHLLAEPCTKTQARIPHRAEHALALPGCADAAEEGEEEDDAGDGEEERRPRPVHRDVVHVDHVQEVGEGGAVHQHPDRQPDRHQAQDLVEVDGGTLILTLGLISGTVYPKKGSLSLLRVQSSAKRLRPGFVNAASKLRQKY